MSTGSAGRIRSMTSISPRSASRAPRSSSGSQIPTAPTSRHNLANSLGRCAV
jgi:hypothetical protein